MAAWMLYECRMNINLCIIYLNAIKILNATVIFCDAGLQEVLFLYACMYAGSRAQQAALSEV
jgi:hypothetical protein